LWAVRSICGRSIREDDREATADGLGAQLSAVHLRSFVRDIPDFPRPGIVFKDITPLLLDPVALDAAVAGLARMAEPLDVDFVVAPEARGFILGGALARALGAGFVPARKPGKLPHETVTEEYVLEYGVDALEVHADALAGGARVLLHDDLLATGGTARALTELVARLGGEVVGCAFLVELGYLGGRARLAPHRVQSLIDFDS
jgi:adenine phosphoribosyltransferase